MLLQVGNGVYFHFVDCCTVLVWHRISCPCTLSCCRLLMVFIAWPKTVSAEILWQLLSSGGQHSNQVKLNKS